jgi:quercetin dioxygenase-like cupin family protein
VEIVRDIKPEFVDERGGISKLLDDGRTIIRSVLLITSKKGSIRANHYHKQDSHYCYFLSGSMRYTEKPLDEGSEKKSTIVKAGDVIYTPPQVAHVMEFLEDSVFITLATKSRHQDAYEEDTVRVKLV